MAWSDTLMDMMGLTMKPPSPEPPVLLGHGERLANVASQTLLDAAALPLPAFSLRQAVLDGALNQFIASPTNVGEAEELQRMRLEAEAVARNARRDH